MKEEKLLRAIGSIDDELIDSAMETQRKKHPTWVRWAAIAACLCLLAASPVGAAMGESLEKFMHNGRVEHTITDRLLLKDLTPEALAAFPDEERQTEYLCFDSKEDAEDFLGIKLPDNPMLEACTQDKLHLETETGEKLDTHCAVKLSTGDKPEPYCLDIELAYRMDGPPIYVMYRLPTEKNPYDTGGGVGIDTQTYDESVEYTDAEGRTWDLYIRRHDYGGLSACALSNLNGALTWINLCHSYNLSAETLKTLMIEIMEAYE